MKSTEPASNRFPARRLLPSGWVELASRAIRWLFGDSRRSGDAVLDGPAKRERRARAISATDSDSARKLRFWFTERNRDTL